MSSKNQTFTQNKRSYRARNSGRSKPETKRPPSPPKVVEPPKPVEIPKPKETESVPDLPPGFEPSGFAFDKIDEIPANFSIDEWKNMTTIGRVINWDKQSAPHQILLWNQMRIENPQACFHLWEKFSLDQKKKFWPQLISDELASNFWWFIPSNQHYDFYKSLGAVNQLATWFKLQEHQKVAIVDYMENHELIQLWYDLKHLAKKTLLPCLKVDKCRILWESVADSRQHIWKSIKDDPTVLLEFHVEFEKYETPLENSSYKSAYDLVFGDLIN
jgi:hypothetical protein